MRTITLLPIYFLSSSFVLVSNYWFADEKEPVHLDGRYRIAAPMKFTTPGVKGSKLHYNDADASVYYTQHLNKNNSLSYQLGYYHMTIDWKQNPRFSGSEYNYGVASVGWVSHSIDKWRWALAGSVSMGLYDFRPMQTGVAYLMAWGRYQFSEHTHVHIGLYGLTGLRNIYFLPIIGMDFPVTRQLHISAIFPFDIAARYFFNKHWYTCLSLKAFGSPYRFPQRAREGKDGYDDGIFQIYSTTGDLSLNYRQTNRINIGISGGYSMGGWLLIKNSHNHHGKYYKFNGAPYGQVNLTLSL